MTSTYKLAQLINYARYKASWFSSAWFSLFQPMRQTTVNCFAGFGILLEGMAPSCPEVALAVLSEAGHPIAGLNEQISITV